MLNKKTDVRWKMIKTQTKGYIAKEQKKLKRMGAIILAVLTVLGGTIIVFQFKNKQPMIDNQPAKIVKEFDKKGEEKKIFLENVEEIKSGLYKISTLNFGEEMMRVNETFGESSKNFVVMQGNFRILYSLDINRVKVDYNFDTKDVILKVPKDAIKVESVELVGEFKEIKKVESWGNKLKDMIPGMNDNEEIKEGAIRQLLKNARVQADNKSFNELKQDAKDGLEEVVRKLNYSDLNYSIEFTDSQSIGINRTK